jgi:NAD+ kinase
MAMPEDFVLVRHGESEGNVAGDRAKKGDDSLFTKEFMSRHSSQWRLTKRGREQAISAGEWIRKHLQLPFDRHNTSDYIRAMETAALLNLDDAEWMPDFYLRERDWGEMDVMPLQMRKERFKESLTKKHDQPLLWPPPNGVPLADLCLRMDRTLDTAHREMGGKRMITVCHGEVMWAYRVRLERISTERFNELDRSKHPHDRIHNCQILHYTRRNPETRKLGPYLGWMRSVCPWDEQLSSNNWRPIVRKKYSNQELLERVEKVQAMYE